MESQPQNPECRINPESFHPCKWIKLPRPQCLYDDVTNYVFQRFGARSLYALHIELRRANECTNQTAM